MEIMEGLGDTDEALEFIDLNKNDIEGKKYFLETIIRIEKIEKKIQ